jgi:hypothetical protein
MTIAYLPSEDTLLLKTGAVKGKPTKEVGSFKLWWEKDGTIRAIALQSYTEELKEFRKPLHTIRLGGIWKGVTVTEEEIREAREELLSSLEEAW